MHSLASSNLQAPEEWNAASSGEAEVLGATPQNLVAKANWRPGFVLPISQYYSFSLWTGASFLVPFFRHTFLFTWIVGQKEQDAFNNSVLIFSINQPGKLSHI